MTKEDQLKRLQEKTILLSVVTQERDELRAVVQEMDDGDNPGLSGALQDPQPHDTRQGR